MLFDSSWRDRKEAVKNVREARMTSRRIAIHFAHRRVRCVARRALLFSPRMSAENMTLVERFSRTPDGLLRYEFTGGCFSVHGLL